MFKMPETKWDGQRLSYLILFIIFAAVMAYFITAEFVNPLLNEYDPYYHVAVADFMRHDGVLTHFHWTQFSTFKDFFSDKEYLLHILIMPSFLFTHDLILAGKYSIVLLNFLFLLSYVFVLRRYLPPHLAGLFLFLPVFSSHFCIYFTYLRPATLGNIFFILAIYCMIEKRWIGAAVMSIAYSLGHVAFLPLIPFVILCEFIRYRWHGEFFLRNVYAVIIGIMLGLIIHPNYPNDLLSVYLNAILVPLYNINKVPLDFGRELYAATTDSAFYSNIMIFFSLLIAFCMALRGKIKASMATMVWFMVSMGYLLFSLLGNRYWYVLNVVFFIFFASYVNDWRAGRPWRDLSRQINFFVLIFFAVALGSYNVNRTQFYGDMRGYIYVSRHYVNVGRWMAKHIPPGETVYHAYWSDSPFFICLNPKDNYISVLDPIYTFYRYPNEYSLYLALKQGQVDDPSRVLLEVFKSRYGYAARGCWLYGIAKSRPERFKVLYEDDMGIVYETFYKKPVVPPKPVPVKQHKKKGWFL